MDGRLVESKWCNRCLEWDLLHRLCQILHMEGKSQELSSEKKKKQIKKIKKTAQI